MLFWMIVKVALKSLSANKLRSILAMLGIIIGVGAVIAMLAIGAGAQQQVLARFTAMGTNLLVIRPGQRGFGGVMNGTQQNLSVDDAQEILSVPGVLAVAPVVSKNVQVKYFNQNTNTNLLGTSETYLPIRDFHIATGRMFTDSDVDHWARVCVIGPVTATNLFGISDPVDQIVKVNGINFHVTGVLIAKGDQGWFNPDDQIIVPYTTAMHIVLGVTNLREIDVEAANGVDVNALQDAITTLIRKLHKTQPGAPSDVNIQNQADLIAGATEATQIFKILLGSVAGISLFVGGIGIMNIMLVTVTERTREIGIRKAIGARDYDILSQFLIEALLMCGVGGLSGVAIGVGAAAAIAKFTSLPAVVQPFSIILALTVSAAVGVFFGYYPAFRASKLDPIEALRYE
jgi:putative ABC transport system permease protein